MVTTLIVPPVLKFLYAGYRVPAKMPEEEE
jgi:hypothetical protein